MTDNQIYKLVDLVEEIRKVDKMVQLHSAKNLGDKVMLSQYQAKKAKLISYLVRDLNTPAFRSPKGFVILKKLLNQFYSDSEPELLSENQNHHSDELEKLEGALWQ